MPTQQAQKAIKKDLALLHKTQDYTMGINAFAVCLTCLELHKDYTMYGADKTDFCIVQGHNVVILETDRDYSRLNDGDVRTLMQE